MAKGGQGGQSWLGENNVWISALTAAVVFLVMSGVGISSCDFGGDPTPIEQHATDCQQAWADTQAGEADEETVKMTKTSFCEQTNTAAIAEEQADQQKALLEAQEDLQETRTPTTQQASGGDYEVLYVESHEGEAP